MMKGIACLAVAVCVTAVPAAGCSSKREDAPQKGGTAAPPAASGSAAAGAGDRSGSSIANAKPLLASAPATFDIPCKGAVFVGPFHFQRDPQKITVGTRAKSKNGEQVCTGGNWVDSKDAIVMIANTGCAEGAQPHDDQVVVEYAPSSGGSGANPVYLKLGFAEERQPGCATATMTLTLR